MQGLTDIITIANLVDNLRAARSQYKHRAETVRLERDEFEKSISYHVEMLAEAKSSLEESERQLRASALADHKVTGNKHPHPAVTIKQGKDVTACEYDEAKALDLAMERKVALAVSSVWNPSRARSLDRQAFEAMMLATPESWRPDWFRVRTTTPEPTATIAREIAAPDHLGDANKKGDSDGD